jgi:hypothetical protein
VLNIASPLVFPPTAVGRWLGARFVGLNAVFTFCL